VPAPATAQPPAAVSPAEAQAFAKAVVSDPAGAEPAAAEQPTPPAASPAAETTEERRARIMAEYRVMQQRAQEEMRRRWGQGAMPAAPYGYPGYPPAYQPQR
jgi:hypothetical protein